MPLGKLEHGDRPRGLRQRAPEKRLDPRRIDPLLLAHFRRLVEADVSGARLAHRPVRSDSEKSISASCPLHGHERVEVSAEYAIEILRRKARLRDLAKDRAVIVAAVPAWIAVRPVTSVQAT